MPILPSSIGAGEERDLYETLLFADRDDAGPADLSRSDTLLLVLITARDKQGRPNSRDVRRHLFSVHENIPEGLEPQRLRWEAYQAQDMWQVASAALLRWAISIIDEFDEGRSLPEIHAEVTARLIDRMGEVADRNWHMFVEDVEASDVALDERFRRTTGSRVAPEDAGFLAVEQIAAVQKRVCSRADLEGEIARSFQLSGGGRSIRSELVWLQDRQNQPLRNVVADLIKQRVVRRHSWVATQKLRRQRDYTFLFEARDGRLAYRSQYQPVPTTPRLDPAVTFLSDIGLLAPDGCTPLGDKVVGALE